MDKMARNIAPILATYEIADRGKSDIMTTTGERRSLFSTLTAQAIFAIALATGYPMNSDAQNLPSTVPLRMPALSPDGEKVIPEDVAFNEKCLSLLDNETSKNWNLGTPLMTDSPEWGLVWRVDFSVSNIDTQPYVNRIVCWQGLQGQLMQNFAFGQSISPLPTKSK